ncbi:collagen-like domain-containing protein [Lysinibacillus fusiformis]
MLKEKQGYRSYGATGPQGLAGAPGATGVQGEAGVTGMRGPKGETGLTGATGPQGLAGAPGATDVQGEAGVTGTTGPQGLAGAPGATGVQGEAGVTGMRGPQGETGLTGATGPQGLAGAPGATGVQGEAGVTGMRGPQGETGVAGTTGSSGSGLMEVFLSTDQSVGNNDFLGTGNSSASFVRSSIVIPENAIIRSLTLNIRDHSLSAGQTASAQIYISANCGFTAPIATGIIAIVTGPNSSASPNCCAKTTANFSISSCTLLSLQVTTTGGAFSNGVSATILFNTV